MYLGSIGASDEEAGVEWSHFGLNRQPFRPAVDPESYFPAASHEAALGAITDGFARRDPMVLLDGPPGTGKTLVARKWLEHLLPDVPRVVVPNARAESPAELHQAILFDLAKPYHGLSEQELRLAVTGHILDAAVEGAYPTVLVLDEAQHLGRPALEELRLLCNLETRQGAALFIVLVAQPALREMLALPVHEPLAQRLAIRAALTPLATEESADYVRHQVRAAGGEPERVLTDDAIPMLAGACRGVPRLMNRAALLALELAAANESIQADVEAVLEALERLGMSAAESDQPADPVLLPHPARTVGPAKSRRGKSGIAASVGEAAAVRLTKERPSRKRSA
jgi:type II secretory pathway predicted ATPase ExeA